MPTDRPRAAPERFADRHHAGVALARRLEHLRDEPVVVLALPRGGVPVARPAADHLGAPLDVLLVRKLGLPEQPELAMGAIGEDGVLVLNDDVLSRAGVDRGQLDAVIAAESAELARRAARYRGGRAPAHVQGRTAVVVDDGVATGATARAACQVARARHAGRVVLAVPVAPPDVVAAFADVADEVVTVAQPEPFHAIGLFYDDFTQTTDEEVVALLTRSDGDAP
ncbi:MAG: phosphoribosyltransferase [Acidimicrobiia bacterium]|nr:phosphoribosyltransferase [Acidimicrobiia bacterium]